MNALFIRIAPFLFKPTLEHPDPSIRLLALNRLDLNADQQQSTFLNWLQQEEDQQLLSQVLPRFTNLQKLVELFNQNQSNTDLSQALSQHLEFLLVNEAQLSSEERQALALQINDPMLMLNLVQQCKPQELRLALLAKLDCNEEDWLNIALSNNLAKVRQVAAEKITSEAALERLVKEAQGDKRVQRMARDKLNVYRAKQQAETAAAQQRQQLVEQLQKLVSIGDETLYEARLEHLTNQWQALTLAENAELTARFEQLYQKAQTFIAKLQAKEAELLAQEAVRQAAQEQQVQLLSQLTELVTALEAQPIETEPLLIRQLEAEWQQSLSLIHI